MCIRDSTGARREAWRWQPARDRAEYQRGQCDRGRIATLHDWRAVHFRGPAGGGRQGTLSIAAALGILDDRGGRDVLRALHWIVREVSEAITDVTKRRREDVTT